MKRLFGILLSAAAILFLSGCGEKDPLVAEAINWDELPELPNAYGLGGAFAGVSQGALIVAGGAVSPEAPEAKHGEIVWHDDLYVLSDDEPTGWLMGFKLKQPVAYGASVSTAESLILIGGKNAEGYQEVVTRITWDPATRTIEQESLPSLPEPVAFTDAARIGGTLYVAGGQTAGLSRVFWSLDLADLEAGWKVLEPWKGPSRRKAVAVTQNIGNNVFFFIMGGENLVERDDGMIQVTPVTDGYRYSPRDRQWKRVAESPHAITAAPAIDYGQSHILVFGGASQQYPTNDLSVEHPGPSRDLLAYHTITDTWIKAGEIPLSVVAAEAVAWKGGIVLASGEVRAGSNTPKIQRMIHHPGAHASFGFPNYAVLIIYMVALLYMGIYFSKREEGTEDYFLAGRRVPWWAAGLSIKGTVLSALTYISYPAMVYSMDWFLYPAVLGLVLVPIITIYFYLPFYRRLKLTTAFEYLEVRFNLPVRLYGSAQFIIFQMARISIILYLPAMVLSTITGINIYVCILSMGLLSTFYTVLGGIEAVVWTDVLQVFIFFSGITAALFIVPYHIDGGVMGLIELGMADDKYRILYLDWDITYPTLWVVILGGGCGTLIQYSADQAQIQRYLTTKDERSAANGLWLNVFLAVPSGFLFYAMGTALYAYYKTHPESLSLGMQNDAIFPLFVAQQIPTGLAGFIIAAIFAASMSSLDSGMNSMATAFVTDFYRRFKPDKSERTYLKVARWFTLFTGLFATAVALILIGSDIQSAALFFLAALGLFSSGLAGLFILGIFTRRAKGVGAFVGAIVSALVLYFVRVHTPVNFMLYTFVGIAVCVLVGYLASLVIPEKGKSLEGLSLYTALPKED